MKRASLADVTPESTDGRRLRTAATRRKIVDAVLQLHRDGHIRPPMQAIADQAGVSLRSVFQHFPEKEQLTAEVMNVLAERRDFKLPTPEIDATVPVDERIEQFLDAHIQALEDMTPHRRASNQLLAASKVLQERRATVRQWYHAQVAAWFKPELARLLPKPRRRWLDALGTLTDWEMWDSLRTYPARSVADARILLTMLVKAALRQIEEEAERARD